MLTAAISIFLAGPVPAPPTARWTQEPAAYRNVKWGATLADVVAAGVFKDGGTCDCGAGREGQTEGFCSPEPETDPARVPVSRMCMTSLTVGTTEVSDFWQFREDRLVGASWTFPAKQYEALREIFIGKYGPPAGTAAPVFKTLMGVTAHNEALSWRGPRVTVELKRFGTTIEDGVAHFFTNTFLAENERAKRNAQRQGAKVF